MQCIDNITSSTHLHWSNGFIKQQMKTLKTAQSTAKDAGTSLKMLLLELWSTPITPNMPSPQEILHNCTIQWPGKPSTPVDMEMVWDYLIARKVTQKEIFQQVPQHETPVHPQPWPVCVIPFPSQSVVLHTWQHLPPEATGLMPRASVIMGPDSTSIHYNRTSPQSTPSHRRP